MLLPELFLPGRANQSWPESGMDSLKNCLNKHWFRNYPHHVRYDYNSRGFRDQEWPENLDSVIWCVGDSFTEGLGSPREHTWPYLLSKSLGRRTINVSLDGASNDWIYRIVCDILTQFPSADIVVQWSYLHRREATVEDAAKTKFQSFYKNVRARHWPREVDSIADLPQSIQSELIDLHGWDPDAVITAEDRRLHAINDTWQDDVVRTKTYVDDLGSRVIHSAIPKWTPLAQPDSRLFELLKTVISVPQLDHARDYHHYDQVTADWFVKKITPILQRDAT